MGIDSGSLSSQFACQHKRWISWSSKCEMPSHVEGSLPYFPTLEASDYYIRPSLKEVAAREYMDPGFSSRVLDFTVGRFGYGSVKYPGKTDIRFLDLDKIVKFHKHEVIVYEDETTKPLVGQGLNKPAEVTLVLRIRPNIDEKQKDHIVKKLRQSVEGQGAHFVSFDPKSGEWKFFVHHFSRFGLSEDDEEDIMMEDTASAQDIMEMNHGEISDVEEENQVDPSGIVLSHSLPAHLGLDPVKMKEMRLLMFHDDEEEAEDFNQIPAHYDPSFGREYIRPPLHNASQRMSHISSVRKTPLALLEYKHGSFDTNSPVAILLAQENKAMPPRTFKEGFKLDLKRETPVTIKHSRNIADAGLLMGRSFRVGWGPNGILVHSGTPIGSNGSQNMLSSVIHFEKIAIDSVVRDENNKVREELVDMVIDSPLDLHKGIFHQTKEIEVGSFNLRLQKLVSNRLMLSEICRSYVDIIEKQLNVAGLSPSARLVLTHQIMVWELIKVLFSDREDGGKLKSPGDDLEEEMVQDGKEPSVKVDLDALPLIRRAEFSHWLQENVAHQVQENFSSLDESSYMEYILLLLSGRQLDAAVEMAISRGDVRLACLLSQSGGSMVNRSDIAQQLDLWRINGLDVSFIQKDRIRLYELLAGNIHGAFHDIKVDWKRFLGLLMWYQLAPSLSLPTVFRTYQHLLEDDKAPYPLPIYIDEGLVEEADNTHAVKRYDLSYYLMLLHGSEESEVGFLKTMFSAFSSTHDPLDYHMIWHQRAVLEAVGAISSKDLHVLDMGFVSQLLCLGQCHWAIYVVLHMPQSEDFPYLHANLIWEILFQYCESWSSQESQRQAIENLGIPKAWLHEAMAVYFNYYGDLSKALEHFLQCANWQRAHTIFITAVAHKLFLSAKESEIWKLATSMEDHKSEIENWDLGAGIYISFYLLRSSLQKAENTMNELDSLVNRNSACREFLGQLNQSLAVWGARLPIDVRVVYSKMADEICNLLLSDIGEDPTRDVQLSCFDTVFSAPIPEDLRSSHLQDALSLFTCFLSEVTT